jgi:hypothetical protein
LGHVLHSDFDNFAFRAQSYDATYATYDVRLENTLYSFSSPLTTAAA